MQPLHLTRVGRGTAILGLVLTVALAGCGKSDKPADSTSPAASPSSTSKTPTTNPSTAAMPPAPGSAYSAPRMPMDPLDPATLGPRNDFDLRLIPSDGFLALVVHPQRLTADPLLGKSITEFLKSLPLLFSELGFGPADVARFTLALQQVEASPNDAPLRAVISFQFAGPVDGNRVAATFIELQTGMPPREQRLGDKTYFVNTEAPMQIGLPPAPPVGAVVRDDQTVVLFLGHIIESIVRGQDATGHLATRLAHADMNCDAMAVVSLESDDQLGRELQSQLMGGLAPETIQGFAPLLQIPPMLRSAQLLVNLQSDSLATLSVDATSSQNADSVEQTLGGYLDLGRQILPAMIQMTAHPDAPPGDADLLTLANEALAGLAMSKNGRSLQVRLAKPPSFTTVVPVLVEQVLTDARVAMERQMLEEDLMEVFYGMQVYRVQHGTLPPAAIRDASGRPLLSWRVAVLPYLGEQELYDRFKLDEPWDSPHNRPLLEQIPRVYSDPGLAQGLTRFLVFTGEGTPLQVADIPPYLRSMAQKLAIVQVAADRAVPWTAPQDVFYTDAPLDQLLGDNANGACLGITFAGRPVDVPLDLDPEVIRPYIVITPEELNAPPEPTGFMGMDPGAMMPMQYPSMEPAVGGGDDAAPTREIPVEPPPADPFGGSSFDRYETLPPPTMPSGAGPVPMGPSEIPSAQPAYLTQPSQPAQPSPPMGNPLRPY